MLNKAKKAEKRELQRLAEQAEQERLAEEDLSVPGGRKTPAVTDSLYKK